MTPDLKCAVCKSADRNEIETALLQGRTANSIAKNYTMSRNTIERHAQKCIPEILARSRHADVLKRGDMIVNRADRLWDESIAVMERAKGDSERTIEELVADVPEPYREGLAYAAKVLAACDVRVLHAIREARPSLELLAKAVGQIKDETTVNIHLAPDFAELRDAILKALAPHREAYQDVADAMLEFVARRTVPDGDSALH